MPRDAGEGPPASHFTFHFSSFTLHASSLHPVFCTLKRPHSRWTHKRHPTMPTTDLIVIRHGQTQWNLEERSQGHGDSPLTPQGVEQADRVGRRLAPMEPDALYSSDLRRAVDTAEAIGRYTELKARIDPRLREQNFGVFEGLTLTERIQRYPEAHAVWESKDPDARIPEGESVRERCEIVVGCLDELAARHRGQRIVVVTHGGNLNAIMRRCMNIPLDAPRPFIILNASMNVFRIDADRWQLVTWGDTAHLA